MKRSRLREMSMEVIVGAFIFMILLALGFFTIIFGSKNFFREVYPVEVVFENVMGLREGDKVFMRGVDVGKIQNITVSNDGVHVISSLLKPIEIREDYRAEILTSSVLGGRFMNIWEGRDGAVLPDNTVLIGTIPIDLVEEASKTITVLKKSLTEGGIIANVEAAMLDFRELTHKLNKSDGTLSLFLEDKSLYNDLLAITADLQKFSSSLMDGEGLLGKLLADNEKLYEDLTVTIHSFREMSELFHNSEGTVGKLIHDDSVYLELELLLQEARATIDDIREASPITTFSSVLFGAF